jgi:hypothetical protein
MKINLSFKDYLEAKNRLKQAGENCPRIKQLYEVRKYCKIPLHDGINEEEKVYVSLKPKDTIEILWEYQAVDHPIPLQLCLTFDDDKIMYFTWSNAKINKWVESSIYTL